MTLPPGAYEIAKARDNGRRPADPVIVSFCGWQRDLPNPQVLATRPDHDWRFMTGLESFVFLGSGAKHVRETLRALAAPVERLSLWDIDKEQGVGIHAVWDLVGREWHYLLPEDRRRARFIRWHQAPWKAWENRAFAA